MSLRPWPYSSLSGASPLVGLLNGLGTANAGCALQLEAGLRAAGLSTRVRHVLDLLAEALPAAGGRR